MLFRSLSLARKTDVDDDCCTNTSLYTPMPILLVPVLLRMPDPEPQLRVCERRRLPLLLPPLLLVPLRLPLRVLLGVVDRLSREEESVPHRSRLRTRERTWSAIAAFRSFLRSATFCLIFVWTAEYAVVPIFV